MWEDKDGYRVMKWAEQHSTPGNPYYEFAQQHGGVKHAIVYIIALGDITYDTGDYRTA